MKENETTVSKIMGYVNKAGIAVLMNLLFLVSCIPLVTIGAAWSGLYGAVRYTIRGESWFEGYKTGFKTKFLRNTLTWVIGVLVGYYVLDNVVVCVNLLLAPLEGVAIGSVIGMLSFSGILLLLIALFLTGMIPVNLYIPTVNDRWLKNTWRMIFTSPLQILGAAVLMWLPVVLLLFFPGILFELLLVFIAIYFVMAIFLMTILLKNPLIRVLQRERELYPEDYTQ